MKSIENEIRAALEAANEAEPVAPFQGSPDDIFDMAVAEAGRRLRDEPFDVGETFLSNVLKEANKAAERRAEEKRREQEQTQELSVLDVIRGSTLPRERKYELIRNEVARLRALISELEGELDG